MDRRTIPREPSRSPCTASPERQIATCDGAAETSILALLVRKASPLALAPSPVTSRHGKRRSLRPERSSAWGPPVAMERPDFEIVPRATRHDLPRRPVSSLAAAHTTVFRRIAGYRSEMQRHQVRCGDAVELLAGIEPGTVDLVYIDPPFGTGLTLRARNRRTGATSEFDDRWAGMADYIAWLRSVLAPTVDALRADGALFLHCDWRASHHIRILLDDIMGPENFRNEIIWHYRRWTAAQASLQRLHQTIYYYARSKAHQPDIPLTDYSPTTNLDQIWQARARNENKIAAYAMSGKVPRNNGAKRGVPLGDVWEVPPLNPKARERVGYPTQKPLVLLERIIEIASSPDDLVLDPCCGSGTTLVAAKLLGRRALGIDIAPRAVELSKARLVAPVRSSSKVVDGRHDFERRWVSSEYGWTLQLLNAHPVQRNKYIHGYLSPTGLETLGFPNTWSVPVALVEGPQSVVEDWIRKLDDLIVRKASDAALLLVRPWSRTTRGCGPSGRIVAAPWPNEEKEFKAIGDRVRRWLTSMRRESTLTGASAGPHPSGP